MDLDNDDKLLWQAKQVIVILDENGATIKFKKDSSLFGYLTWLIKHDEM